MQIANCKLWPYRSPGKPKLNPRFSPGRDGRILVWWWARPFLAFALYQAWWWRSTGYLHAHFLATVRCVCKAAVSPWSRSLGRMASLPILLTRKSRGWVLVAYLFGQPHHHTTTE